MWTDKERNGDLLEEEEGSTHSHPTGTIKKTSSRFLENITNAWRERREARGCE